MITLGIWDGHDAGACLLDDEQILIAINEERLSRRKLEIGFPVRSIQACLSYAKLTPQQIDNVALSTTDFSKTLTRVFPRLREEYYLLRRKKKEPGRLNHLKKRLKYRLTELPPSNFSKQISGWVIRRELRKLGFEEVSLEFVDHHRAHAVAAALCSGFKESLVLTIDGIGDALSGGIWTFQNGELTPLQMLSGKHSLGIFFEHVTNLLNMRELEDEGKVMALANFACPVPDAENPLLGFFSISGLQIKAQYSSARMYHELSRVLWRFPPEQFAYMAQRVLELRVVELVKKALYETKQTHLSYSGGVASNVKVNMLLRELPEVAECFVFPHMGDGGLALGAAMESHFRQGKCRRVSLFDVYLGVEFSREEHLSALKRFSGIGVEECEDIAQKAAMLICSGEILFWFQGRMELGPRALGARSIIALPDSLDLKDDLNLRLKKRVWYQPFCPSMLEEDAKEVLENYRGEKNPFMTSAYRTKKEKRSLVRGVVNVDGTCRPQIVPADTNTPYTKLLLEVKKIRGSGIILNTSFNLHGEPLVCSPDEALQTFMKTDIDFMVMGNFLVRKSSC